MLETLGVLQKVQHRITTGPRNCTPRYTSKRTENRDSKQVHIHACLYHRYSQQPKGGDSPNVHKRRKRQTNSIYTDSGTYGILFNYKKVLDIDKCYRVDESQNMLFERSHVQKVIIEWFHLYEISKIYKSIETKCRLVLPGARERNKMEKLVDRGFYFRRMEMFQNY